MTAFERLEPGTAAWTAYHANHIQRYQFAAAELRSFSPARVLDIACGVGYGSRHLADALDAQIVAVDRDPRALAVAAERFAHPAVQWMKGDCSSVDRLAAHGPFVLLFVASA